MRLRTLVAASVLSLIATLAGPVSLADAAAPTGELTIESATHPLACGGGFSRYVFGGCIPGIDVVAADTTPTDGHSWKLVVSPGISNATLLGVRATWLDGVDGVGHIDFSLSPTPWFTNGQTYTFVVEEYDGTTLVDTSAPATLTYQQVIGPKQGVIPAVTSQGKEAFLAGTTLTARYSGAWESGLTFQRKVIISVGKENDIPAATDVTRLSSSGGTSSALTFSLPTAYVGRYVWVSILGQKADKDDWGVFWKPTLIVRATPKAWIKSFGTKSGTPKVGKKLTVGKPTYSIAGKRAKLGRHYQWYVGGRAIAGATKSSFTLPRRAKGKKVAVLVLVSKKNYQDRSKSIRFGAVR